MTDRLISLTVGTKEAAEWFNTFQQMGNLANDLGKTHHYVSISSTEVDGEEESYDGEENLYYDHHTLNKVRFALTKVLDDTGVNVAINEMLNAGIVFRERR